MTTDVSRRSFLSAAALTAASYGRVLGANDRVGVGLIGFGLIGKRHALTYKELPDAQIVAVSDAHRGRLDEAVGFAGGGARACPDFRKLLDAKDVAAVVVATPDHWHALMTMLACAAGKDVYVEKPMTLFVREGRWMTDVARRHKRVVQVGTQQRSGRHYQRARELIRNGHIGKVVSVRMEAYRNITPGFGNPPDSDPPPELDWEMWLGPAPARRYNPNRAIYHFRWFWDYSGGQTTNLGAHSLDVVEWALGLDTLKAVTSAGGRFALTDNGETPDTQDAIFEFDGWTVTWSMRECARGERSDFPLRFHGTKGTLGITRSGFQVTADPDAPPESAIPQFTGAHPVGGPKSGKPAGPVEPRTEAIEDRTGDGRAQFRDHARNFLDCVKSRQPPIADVADGHKVAVACHLANLSLRLGRRLRWDWRTETVVGDAEATAQLERPYRAPWDREKKALRVG